jgi:tetratricopeptide (TPR) repeat protein
MAPQQMFSKAPPMQSYTPAMQSYAPPVVQQPQPPVPLAQAGPQLTFPSQGGTAYLRKQGYAYAVQPFRNGSDAIAYFEAAVNRAPDSPVLLDDLGSAYNNRATELAASGNLDAAHQLLERALAIHRNSTDRTRLDSTLSNYMLLLVKQGRLADAQHLFSNYQQGNLACFNPAR